MNKNYSLIIESFFKDNPGIYLVKSGGPMGPVTLVKIVNNRDNIIKILISYHNNPIIEDKYKISLMNLIKKYKKKQNSTKLYKCYITPRCYPPYVKANP